MYPQLQASRCLFNNIKITRLVNPNQQSNQNVIPKRWSGHNVMEITPSNYGWKHFKDMLHFYCMLAGIPIITIATIINVRANPELTEVPEGYEPRHWEYYKHPVTRWMAKYCFKPMELDHELMLARFENHSEYKLLRDVQRNVEKVMLFYNDHRTRYFKPFFAEIFRRARDGNLYGIDYAYTNEGQYIDIAYNPAYNPVPTEGYPPTSD